MWTLVTGGSKRLGAALCLSLAEKGRSVVVHYNHSHDEALEVALQCREKGVQAEIIQGDFSSTITSQDFINRYLKQFCDTEGLINNVGEYFIGSCLNTSVEEWSYLFQVNLHTPIMLAKSLTPALLRNKGQIINIGVSGLYRHIGSIYATAYMLSKQGLWGVTQSLARELASQGVRVNMVSPGELENSVDHHRIPMQRPAACWEVCRVVNFLLDPESHYITGQNIEVAGGLGLGTA